MRWITLPLDQLRVFERTVPRPASAGFLFDGYTRGAMNTVRYVRLKKFEELTGYTVKAIEGKIATHVWREGHE